jgi:hypothetical protein
MKLARRVQYGGARAGIGLSDVDREADELAFYKTAKVLLMGMWEVTPP